MAKKSQGKHNPSGPRMESSTMNVPASQTYPLPYQKCFIIYKCDASYQKKVDEMTIKIIPERHIQPFHEIWIILCSMIGSCAMYYLGKWRMKNVIKIRCGLNMVAN